MRTTDFSNAPRRAQAGAMFTGATRYNSVKEWATLSLTWRKFVKRMKASPGYCWHKIYWEPPYTLGTIAYFDTMEDLFAVARTPEHRKLMRWLADGTDDQATAGYIRLYRADPHGYTSGIWRAEDRSMSHIEEYSPLPGDTKPQRVDDAASEIR